MTDEPLQPTSCARKLRALADADRLRIVHCLRDGPRNVGDLAAAVGEEVVNVSHHLQVLRNEGLVLAEKHGRYVVYQLNPDVFRPGDGPEHLDLGCCRLEMPRE